jgi:hypothetical protein
MSDEVKTLGEVGQVVAITPEDCAAALDFWKHFNIPVSATMQDAFEAFLKDPTYINQLRVKREVTKEICTSTHEAFKDEMFVKIVSECQDITYEMAFDEQLEDLLTVDKDKKTPVTE